MSHFFDDEADMSGDEDLHADDAPDHDNDTDLDDFIVQDDAVEPSQSSMSSRSALRGGTEERKGQDGFGSQATGDEFGDEDSREFAQLLRLTPPARGGRQQQQPPQLRLPFPFPRPQQGRHGGGAGGDGNGNGDGDADASNMGGAGAGAGDDDGAMGEDNILMLTRITQTEFDNAQKELFIETMAELANPDLTDENERIRLVCKLIQEPSLPNTVQALHKCMITKVMQPILRMIYTMCVCEADITLTAHESLKRLLAQANALSNWLHFRHIMIHPTESLFAMNLTQVMLDSAPPYWPDMEKDGAFAARWALVQLNREQARHFEGHVYKEVILNGKRTHFWKRQSEVAEYLESLIGGGRSNAKMESIFMDDPEIFTRKAKAICTNKALFPPLNVSRDYVSTPGGVYNIKNDTYISFEDLDADVKIGRAEYINRCRAQLERIHAQRRRIEIRQERDAMGWEVQDDLDGVRPMEELNAEFNDLSFEVSRLEEESQESRSRLQEFLGVDADFQITNTDDIVASIYIPCKLEGYTGRWNGLEHHIPILHDRRLAQAYTESKIMELPTVNERFRGTQMNFLFDTTTMRFESILNTQQFDAVTKFWFMFFLGRTLHPLPVELGGDNFQMGPVLFGLARTGKSLILNVIRKMFPSDKVMETESFGETIFAHEAGIDKWLTICSELERGTNIEVGTLKKKFEGTVVHASRKHKTAVDVLWTSHTIFASNNSLGTVFTNQQGSLSRRLAVFPFMIIPKDSDATLERQIIDHELIYILRKCNICYQIGKEIIMKHYNGDVWKAMPPVVCSQRDEMEMHSIDFFHFVMTHEVLSFGPECVCRVEDLREMFNEYWQSMPSFRKKGRMEWTPEVYSGTLQKLKCVLRRAYIPEMCLQHERAAAVAQRNYRRFHDVYTSSSGQTYEYNPNTGKEDEQKQKQKEKDGKHEHPRRRRRTDVGAIIAPTAAAAAPPAAPAVPVADGPRQVYEYVFGIGRNPRDPARVIPSFVQWKLRRSANAEDAISFHVLEAYIRNFMNDYYKTEQATFVYDTEYLERCLGYRGFTVAEDEQGVKHVYAVIC